MHLSMKYRDDVLALMDEYRRIEGAKGRTVGETTIIQKALGYKDFVGRFRAFNDGTTKGEKGVAFKSIFRLESWLRNEIGEAKYKAFLKRRAAMVLPDDGF